MSTHHPNRRIRLGPRPARCLRHHVWMAACADCLDARADVVAPALERPAAA